MVFPFFSPQITKKKLFLMERKRSIHPREARRKRKRRPRADSAPVAVPVVGAVRGVSAGAKRPSPPPLKTLPPPNPTSRETRPTRMREVVEAVEAVAIRPDRGRRKDNQRTSPNRTIQTATKRHSRRSRQISPSREFSVCLCCSSGLSYSMVNFIIKVLAIRSMKMNS